MTLKDTFSIFLNYNSNQLWHKWLEAEAGTFLGQPRSVKMDCGMTSPGVSVTLWENALLLLCLLWLLALRQYIFSSLPLQTKMQYYNASLPRRQSMMAKGQPSRQATDLGSPYSLQKNKKHFFFTSFNYPGHIFFHGFKGGKSKLQSCYILSVTVLPTSCSI